MTPTAAELEQLERRNRAQTRLRWELLRNLVRKDLKVKYKGSTLGFAWSLANPLLLLAVYYVVFQLILKGRIPDFAIYLMSGLLIWNAFSGGVSGAATSVVGNANLVKKVRFPLPVLPLSAVGFALVHFVLQMLVLVVVVLVSGHSILGWQLLLAVPAFAVALLFTVALSLLVAALNVRYRDTQHLLEVSLLAWFWLNPIVYDVGLVRDQLGQWTALYWLNPMANIVATMQRAIYKEPYAYNDGVKTLVLADPGYVWYLEHLGISLAIGAVVFVLGLRSFRKRAADFAEELWSAGEAEAALEPSEALPDPPAAPPEEAGLPPVITAVGVGKRFATYHERATSLKERFVRRRSVVGEEFWALRDVEVAIAPGQTVGLIGANGSGKSTLLKVLAGILQPTLGEVHVIGRIASLLELGAGFNGELSGRDNVYLNASLLGLSRRETNHLFDSVVEFAELAHKIDDPVKHYSSGQYIRLGFAIAVHVDPDVLLVDEVLAVGDENFQKKCLDKITEFRDAGKTILFVSHSLDLVENLCDRVIVMEAGHKIFDGSPAQGTLVLRNRMGGGTATGGTDDAVQLAGIMFSSDPGGTPRVQYDPHEQLTISVDLDVTEEAPDRLYLHAVVLGPHDIPVWQMETEGGVAATPGRVTVDFVVPRAPTLTSVFAVRVHVSDAYTGTPLGVRRFDDLFGIAGPQTGGLLPVDYEFRERS